MKQVACLLIALVTAATATAGLSTVGMLVLDALEHEAWNRIPFAATMLFFTLAMLMGSIELIREIQRPKE